MQVEFNHLDAVKKAESIAKQQARNTLQEDESLSESSDRSEKESEEDSNKSITLMPTRATCTSRAPLQTANEVSESYG